jgi:cephalosporin hydroxylase
MEFWLDIEASVRAASRQLTEGMTKVWEDVARYAHVIRASRPEVIVECGTGNGESARWFAEQGPEVITIDYEQRVARPSRQVRYVIGDSASLWTVAPLCEALAGRRTMVVLDSDHNGWHVRDEIMAWGPAVSVGCYLVIEDGIVRWLPSWRGPGPLEAIAALLEGNPAWRRDEALEALLPVSMSPAGWWERRGGTESVLPGPS